MKEMGEEFISEEALKESENLEARKLIKERLGFETDLAFEIEKEIDENDEQIPAEIFWVRFPSPKNSENLPVEGKIYFPKEPDGRLIIFAPGSPSGDAGTFERKHAKTLVESGNTLVTIRHNGQGIGTEKTPVVFNAPQRIAMMEEKGQDYLGHEKPEGYTWLDITREPITPILDIEKKFDRITLIGHSLGATSMFRSMGILAETNPEVVKKIEKIISLAGYLGRPEETKEGFWHGLKMPLDKLVNDELADAIEDHVNLTQDKEKFAQSVRLLASELMERTIPDHISQVLVIAPHDAVIVMPVIKYTRQSDGEEFAQVYDYPGHHPRSLVIEDFTQPEKKTHKMLGVHPKTLLHLVEMKISGQGPHFRQVRSKEPKH